MNKQLSLSGLMDELSQARTKKKEFLEQMDQLIPWEKWVEEIKPCYYKGERGNKPYGIELMLRLYVLQNLYTLSDDGTVAEVIDSRAFSDFCGVDSSNDVTMTAQLLSGEEDTVHGDSGYLGAEKREDALIRNKDGKKIRYKINRRPSQSKNNSTRSKAQIKRREREKSSVRAKVEHVFAVVKGRFQYRKNRYRGLLKQTAKLNMVFALANLILADRPCLSA